MTAYIIIANGDFLSKDILLEAIQQKTIVALDGAANPLLELGIQPHVILGDFDSWQDVPVSDDIQKIITIDQDKTDLMKAIHYCDAQGATDITLVCATGGRWDHQENAARMLRVAYKKNRPIQLLTAQQTLRYAKDEVVVVHGEKGETCAVMAFPKGAFSSKGLVYDVENYPLEFGFSESVSNALARTHATLSIQGEALIIMPPTLRAQRR